MQESVVNGMEPNASAAHASYATLMESLKQAESRALVWPKHKRVMDPSTSFMTTESIMSSPVVKRSAISLLRKHFDKSRKDLSEVKSKDYSFLSHKRPTWIGRKWLGDEDQDRLLDITLPRVPEAKPLSESLQEPMPYIASHYQVPPKSSTRRRFGREIGIEQAIFKMLNEISIRRKPRDKQHRGRSSPGKKGRSKQAGSKLGYKSEMETEKLEKPGGSKQQAKDKAQKYSKKTKEINETEEPTESLLTKTKAKEKEVVRSSKKSSLDSAQQNAKPSSTEERKLSSISREMQEFITNVKKKAQARESISKMSRTSTGVTKPEPRAKSKERKKKRSLLSEEFDAVTQNILIMLDDPLVIEAFKKNIKILSAKDAKPYLRKFLENEKIPNLRDPFDVQRYLNNLDRTVRKARISIEKRKRSSYEPDEDSISLDLENIERQAFRSSALHKSRGRRSKSRSQDGISTTSSIGKRQGRTVSKEESKETATGTRSVNVPYYGASEEDKKRYQFDAKEFYQFNKERKVPMPMEQYYLMKEKEQALSQKTPTAQGSDVAAKSDVAPEAVAQIDKKLDVETDLAENEFYAPWDETAYNEEVKGAPQHEPMTHTVLTSLPVDQPQRQTTDRAKDGMQFRTLHPFRAFRHYTGTQTRYLTTEQDHYINNFLIPPISVPIRKEGIESSKRIKYDRSQLETLFKDKKEDLPFVAPVTYEELSKLTAEEFFKYFSGLRRDPRSLEYLKSSLALLKNNHSVTYNYRVDQVRRFLYDSDVNLSDMDNISIDDIDLNTFLNYPYPEKYVEEPSDPRVSVSVPVEKVPSKKNLKTERPKRKKTFKPFKCEKQSKDKISEDIIEKKLPKFKRSNIPTQHSCCICKSIGRNGCMRDDPLIVKMKNEMKRRELKAYIREKQLLNKGLDEIFTTNRFKGNRPVLVPCEKPRGGKCVL